MDSVAWTPTRQFSSYSSGREQSWTRCWISIFVDSYLDPKPDERVGILILQVHVLDFSDCAELLKPGFVQLFTQRQWTLPL